MASTTLDRTAMAALFAALADETRLDLLACLQGGECCVCDLEDPLGTYQSRLSFHLKKLRDVGLIEDRREGRRSYYSLRADVLEDLKEALDTLLTGTEEGPGCC